jgi:hypothetical protein
MRATGPIWLTAVAGVFLGLEVWVAEGAGWPTAGLHHLFSIVVGIGAAAALLVVPLIVARWWVILAMVGPAISLTVMQIVGLSVRLDDTTGPAWNYRTVYMLGFAALVMLALFGVGRLFGGAGRGRAQSDQPG